MKRPKYPPPPPSLGPSQRIRQRCPCPCVSSRRWPHPAHPTAPASTPERLEQVAAASHAPRRRHPCPPQCVWQVAFASHAPPGNDVRSCTHGRRRPCPHQHPRASCGRILRPQRPFPVFPARPGRRSLASPHTRLFFSMQEQNGSLYSLGPLRRGGAG